MQTQSCSVYRATSPSGKRYYGISKNVVKRWQQHATDGRNRKNRPLAKAIAKYGFDAMNFEVLFTEHGDNAIDLCKDAEMLLIEFDDTMMPNGYNMTAGGDGVSGYEFTDAVREKMSASHSVYKDNPDHRKKLSDSKIALWQRDGYREKAIKGITEAQNKPEVKAKQSASGFAAWEDNAPRKEAVSKASSLMWANDNFRQKRKDECKALWQTTEHRQKMLDAKPKVRVQCVETGAVFDGAKLAAEWVKATTGRNVVGTHITRCCRSSRTAGGYTWKYV